MEENGSFGRGPLAKWLGKINGMPQTEISNLNLFLTALPCFQDYMIAHDMMCL